ncbi:anti-anti-sigma regulatory factor [Pseudonocardia sediminis]|uniref:Anti-anti-sigma regulatory factor n=1 Tax=Pseudonocardia sediminis TaxID=1397368 RepID=A0A4Q7V1J2_PSEST|nr:STAS domain-containing protein [Pseudonocardia sediminis]RZT87298.1 anti-anti-sigma regulatory factor [Pseudonocardia sediminis]
MPENRFRMAVEAPDDHVRMIRVAGNLDRAAAAGLLRLIDAQVRLHRSGHRRLTHLLVDLEAVHSFEPGGLQVLRHARHSTAGHGVGLHMAGCSGRLHLLPLRARQVLGEFSTFPTVEIALTELTGVPRSSDSGDLPAPRRSPEQRPATGARRGPGDLLSSGRGPHDPAGRAPLTEELM